jgi:hypothetical protein
MVLDMVEICPQDDFSFRKNYELLANINHARTLKELLTFLWEPETDSLLGEKKVETTEMSSMAERETKYGMPFSASNITSNESYRGMERRTRREVVGSEKYSISGPRI